MSTRRQFLNHLMIGGGVTVAMLQPDALAIVGEAVSSLGTDDTPESLANKEWFWSRIQSAFTLDRSVIHLNSGGVSASPQTVHSAMKRYLDDSNQAPSYYMWRHLRDNNEGCGPGWPGPSAATRRRWPSPATQARPWKKSPWAKSNRSWRPDESFQAGR